jgi:hypothetical protein
MNQALVQHAEDQVDDEKRAEDENRRARQRVPECLSIALKAGLKRERLAELLFNLLDGAYCLTDRGARQQIERDGHGRELALMVDHQRRNLHHRIDQRR